MSEWRMKAGCKIGSHYYIFGRRVFRGQPEPYGVYWRFDGSPNQPADNYPRYVNWAYNRNWSGVVNSERIVGTIYKPQTKKVYFFYNDGSYLRYDWPRHGTDKNYPRIVDNTTWPALICGGVSAQDIRAILACPWDSNDIYVFFRNGMYVRYDIDQWRPKPGYPREVNDQTWKGLVNPTKIRGAVNWGDGKAYFFYAGDPTTYLRYDTQGHCAAAGYPRSVEGHWGRGFERPLWQANPL